MLNGQLFKPPRYSKPRRKACQACSSAKARCDRKPGVCTRCRQRKLDCIYDRTSQRNGNTSQPTASARVGALGSLPYSHSGNVLVTSPARPPVFPGATLDQQRMHYPSPPSFNVTSPVSNTGGPPAVKFTNLQMVCPINAADISNRWLKAYIPDPTSRTKHYSDVITRFIYRVLKSYTATIVQAEGIPPFIHHLQTSGAPRSCLSTCFSLARMLHGAVPESESTLSGIIDGEMATVYKDHLTLDAYGLTCAFQAYFIYTMMLFFHISESHSGLWQAVMNLQDLASASTQRAAMCEAEVRNTRPRWEEWIVAESQRRTLYLMYMFDSILSARDGLPTFLGTELKGLLAPANKILWRAGSREEWETQYNKHLARWTDGSLALDELWPMPPELDDEAVAKRRSRVDSWLINADEYATMMYTVTSCTHGS